MKKNPIIGLVTRCITRSGGRLLSVLFLSVMILNGMQLFAQERISIQGEVIDVSGETLPGVNVSVKGTSNGTITDITGKFSLSVLKNEVLVVSFVGYKAQEIPIGEQVNFRIVLEEDVLDLDEVVVTALGIKREKKALGYSVTEVGSDQIAGTAETNPIASLSGKVAGVDISQTSGGATSSSRVVLRGISSINGSNQPLYVIDGVPVRNESLGQAAATGGYDLGDGLSDINPENIESISVLKGASASALYGSRALNGVILITTKKGQATEKLNIVVNSTITFDQVNTSYDDRQKIYGQGNGLFPEDPISAQNAGANWGQRLDDSKMYLQADGVERPYGMVEDNIADFFRTGVTYNNSLSVSGGNEKTTFMFSYANVHNKDVIPKSGLNKNTFLLRGSHKVKDFLTIDAKANFITDKVNNRPAMSEAPNNIGWSLVGLANNFDQAWLKNYKREDESYINYFGSNWRWNPYWTLNETGNNSDKTRFIGVIDATLDFTSNLNLKLRSGIDHYSFRFSDYFNKATPTREAGMMTEDKWDVSEENYEAMLNFNKEVNNLSFGASLGGNIMRYNMQQSTVTALDMIVPGKYSLTNFNERQYVPAEYRKEVQSIYAFANVGYKNFLFLDATYRMDWSSTLPTDNNAYDYYSVSSGFVLTDAVDFDMTWLTYAKLRASYAQVGGDTYSYQLQQDYQLKPFTFMGQYPIATESGDKMKNPELKPQTTNSWEVGLDLRLVDNRIGLDFTYYNQVTVDQIIDLSVSNSTYYNKVVKNAGELVNRGFEVLLTTTPVKTASGFQWDLDFNYARNKNEVKGLGDIPYMPIEEARWMGVAVVAGEGEPFGQIIGNAYQRDNEGNIIHDNNGLPVKAGLQVLGKGVYDWIGGVTNTLSYKGLRVKANFDIKWNGDMFSYTSAQMFGSGASNKTLEGRDEYLEYQKWTQENPGGEWPGEVPGYVGKGVVEVVDEEGNVRYERNTISTAPSTYWGFVSSNIAEQFIYDKSYIKLRDLTISYALPKAWLSGSPIQNVTVGFVGRNLWTIYSNVPDIDPESSYNNGNGQGLEYGSLPARKQYGFNLKVNF